VTAPRALCWRTLVRKLTRSIRMIGWALVATFNASIIAATAGLPPPPPNHCNDFAGVIRPETVARLNRELVQFERETSNQIIVAIYQRLPAQSAPDEYAVRLAQHWQVGRKDRKNGAVLFAFQESHDLRIVTGYGLEGTLPDALCKRILETEIIPRFRTGNFDAGLTAGVHAMMAATRGEYRGSNQNRAAADGAGPVSASSRFIQLIFLIAIIVLVMRFNRRNVVYGRSGRRPWGGGWSVGGGGGGGSSGGSFSGGGGSFGGGGAGGKW